MTRSRLLLGLGAFVVILLTSVLAACGTEEEADERGNGEIAFDAGVTEKPCPDGARDRGCIYLGTLSDLTIGRFAPLGVEIVAAQEDFWARVNKQDGIGGEFDVDATKYVRDTQYNPERHVNVLSEIEPDVAALAQSLGTPPTLAALDLLDQNSLVSHAANWWSGWAFDDRDQGLMLESGQPYCFEAMNMLDHVAKEYGSPETVLAVGYPGDYGGDSAAGTQIWGEANGAEVQTMETAPKDTGENQKAVISEIREVEPDVVVVATGPAEMAEIVGGAVAGGYDGRFMGSVLSFDPAVLETGAGDAIRARYEFGTPWGPFGSDSKAHEAIEEAVGRKLPANDGYTFGWMWSYPMLALLEQGVEDGDLTRENLRSLVPEITVDYEGALPEREYAADGSTVVRGGLIAAPDDSAPLGASVVQEYTVGPTAEEFEFSEACAFAG